MENQKLQEEITKPKNLDILRIIHRLVIRTNGVKGFYSSYASDISRNILRKSPFNRGIKLYELEEVIHIELQIIVEFGHNIPQVVWEIQSKIKSKLEKSLNKKIVKIDVFINGVADMEDLTDNE